MATEQLIEKGKVMSEGLKLLCSDRHGIYIPKMMAWRLYDAGWTINPDDVTVCDSGTDDFYFWETWAHILGNAAFTDENGNIWQLYQDGDLWAYCDELMSDEEKYNFFGEF